MAKQNLREKNNVIINVEDLYKIKEHPVMLQSGVLRILYAHVNRL